MRYEIASSLSKGNRSALKRALRLALVFVLVATGSAQLAAAVSRNDLQAAMRALGFLDSLQKRGTIAIAVIHDGGHNGEALGIAHMLESMRVGSGGAIRANAMTPDELMQSANRPDVIYLLPSAATLPRIAGFVRHNRVVSISNDPACLAAGVCVLMVRGGGGVDIVLDTGLAKEAGAQFASVFVMMVKRK